MVRVLALALAFGIASMFMPRPASAQTGKFGIEEATIEDIQSAILQGKLTSTRIVEPEPH